MTNEVIVVWGTEKTLEANGASCASAAIVQANDATYGVVADGSSYPDAEFTLRCQWATITSIENKFITLLARSLNIQSTNDAIAPTATFQNKYIGTFLISAVAANTDQYMTLRAYDVPAEAEYYFINSSGQTISAGWGLFVKPRSLKPAA